MEMGFYLRNNLMRTILEPDSDFICDIQAPCIQMLSPEEDELAVF